MQLYNKLSAKEREVLIEQAGDERLTLSFINMRTSPTHNSSEIICLLAGASKTF